MSFIPKKTAKTLTKDQVEKFLIEAPDKLWLLCEANTIFKIYGTCRCDELLCLTVNDIKDLEKYIVVNLRNTKNLTT